MDRQLFVLGQDIWNGTDSETILSTADDLSSLGLMKAPFEEFDIMVTMTGPDYLRFTKTQDPYEPQSDRFYNARTEVYRFYIIKDDSPSFRFNYKIKVKNRFIDRKEITKLAFSTAPDYLKNKSVLFDQSNLMEESVRYAKVIAEYSDTMAHLYITTLIVLLSAKNIDKSTEQVKRHGAQSRKRPREYRYITTIKIGKITETMRSNGESRGPVRAHLRRGHIRNQRVGEGLKEIKQIFIQPVFVNADEGWIENQRKEYRVKM